MKLTLADPNYLKDSVTIISELVNEASFKFTPNSIELVAMDPANVAMVIFKLLSSAFVEYDVGQETDIAINLNNLKQILRRAKSTDTLTLELEENKLKITLKGKSTRTFYLPIIDIDEKEQRVPELNFPVEIVTNTNILNDAIEDVDVVGESVSFMAETGLYTVQAEGDLSKAKIEIPQDESTKVNVEGDAKVKAKYSIEYLKKMISASKVADTVTIRFNKDYPLKLDYVSIDKIFISFILAPRVENE
ncbi:proliferating cell nuclear antigen (pcna) [Candidatus Woesearchaeota archaeon]|jgi:proliferating cell nuclear antigen|nr:proliferating cell nuclear antigen (pcna) [Candidatus Woesearchaeota archaeon]MBT6520341.1 proliferating cell nuclear antigen (pcna) [Candidatus Woesearchaeota archaeon]MBT7368294.1 proliferating cell nuclear antigen (pcna) [Candidatus Woesearchaeota archaeon]